MRSKEVRYPVAAMADMDMSDTDDMGVSPEAWMDVEFGPGCWVRDSSCDRFITIDPEHNGPGVAYLVLDRQLRRSTTVVLPHQVH
jgi:hypothetical protein